MLVLAVFDIDTFRVIGLLKLKSRSQCFRKSLKHVMMVHYRWLPFFLSALVVLHFLRSLESKSLFVLTKDP